MSAFATACHRPRWRPEDLRRVLVCKTDHLGDFLVSLPAVRDFTAGLPEVTVGYVVASPTRPLAERVSWLGEVHVHDSPRYSRTGTVSPAHNLDEILARDWDLVIDLTNDGTVALASLRRPSRHRCDVGTLRLRAKARAVFGRGAGVWSTHYAALFYRVLGLPVPEAIVPGTLALREEERRRASELVARGWPGARPLAAIHAGAPWEHRRWPHVRFAEVARRLEEDGFAVILVGGPSDREISHAVATAAGLAPERVLAGEGDLPTAAAVLERAAVFVGNDGGLVHVASTVGTPTVAIFGPQNPELFAPLGSRSVALYEKFECSPCDQQHCHWGRARCLEPIETEVVLAAAREAAREPAREADAGDAP